MTDQPNVEMTDEQKFGATLLSKGQKLATEREQNTKDTARNRMLLRGLADENALTAEQTTKVNALYPKPNRKPKPAPAAPSTTPAGNVGVTMPDGQTPTPPDPDNGQTPAPAAPAAPKPAPTRR